MQLSSGTHIPDGLLAANALLAENSRQGSRTYSGTLHQGFGVVISSTALGIPGTLYDGDVRSRCTGKERDAESGLDYFGARYYASNMGRFMSPDWSAKEDPVPYANLGNPQTLNLYAYVHNNPLSTYDPDGHNAFTDFFKNTWQRIENGFTGYGFHTDAQVQNTVDRTRAALRNGGASPGTIEKLSYKQTYKLGTAKLHQGVNAIDVGEGVVVTLTFGEKVRNTLNHIGETGEAPEGYEGGREFQNREGKLPSTDANGNPIKYQEYDVNPRQPGVNRGGERVVTGSDGSQYSTSDHYDTFTKIK